LNDLTQFEFAFEQLCQQHGQHKVVLVCEDQATKYKALVTTPQCGSQWLIDAATEVISKADERRKRGL